MALFNHKRMTGQTTETKEKLLLGAGIYVKGFDPKTDTYESIREGNKCVGATTGGGTFTASKVGHYLQIDGAPENTKGNYILDYWTAKMQATLQEITAENFQLALAAAKIAAEDGITGYDVIQPKGELDDTDYINSLSFVGRLSGSEKPVVITIFNAFNTGDLTISPQDGKEGTLALDLDAHYDADDLETPPFKIYYPKKA